ncbi:cyanobactin biosynthesis system PatB/AcyB/McaB family protein [Streptosporangium sp. NPDC051022]|uniref:cyanobactin biosynthesis system PatB/AcyB/McaB family protein n=1 Tax=Streptosporangium sp. NPDC051022 TaxID=3155752 RepID=UPI00342C7AFC
MSFPPQAPPVRRPELVQPYTTVDLTPDTPEHLARVRAYLLYGANFNDPQTYTLPTYHQARLSALPGLSALSGASAFSAFL